MKSLKDKDKKVRLWTRQDIRSLKDIETEGVHRIKQDYIEEQFEDIADYYIRHYKWFVDVASKIVPKPEGVEFPIWCAVSDKNMLKPIEGTLVYVLEIDESEIIYFDGQKWDHVLNHLYIPKDEKDRRSYMDEMEMKGFRDVFSFIDGKYAKSYPLEKKRVMDSWMRIFEIEDWNIFNVQGNVWEIRSEDIVDILYYDKEKDLDMN